MRPIRSSLFAPGSDGSEGSFVAPLASGGSPISPDGPPAFDLFEAEASPVQRQTASSSPVEAAVGGDTQYVHVDNVTVNETDGTGAFSVSIIGYTVPAGQEDQTVTFHVPYAFSFGDDGLFDTADDGVDFAGTTGTLAIEVGPYSSGFAEIPFDIIDDAINESNEFFTLSFDDIDGSTHTAPLRSLTTTATSKR